LFNASIPFDTEYAVTVVIGYDDRVTLRPE